MKSNLEQSSFLTLDGMRGLGAFLVVFGHVSFYPRFFGPGIHLGSAAPLVDLFYALSGFVIAFAYEPRLNRGMTTRQFMLSRLVRLYPLYLLGFLLGAAVWLMSWVDGQGRPAGAFITQAIPQLVMLPAPDPDPAAYLYSMNSPAWSLFFELLINLIYVLFWPLIRHTRAVVGLMVFGAVTLIPVSFQYGDTGMGATWHLFWGGFSRVCYSFFAGVLIFRLVGAPRETATRRSRWSPVLVLALIPFSLMQFPPALAPWCGLLQVLVLSPLLVYLACRVQPPRWLARPMFFAGAISYAVYMVHYPIYRMAKRIGWNFPEIFEASAPWSGLLLLAAVFPIAYAAHKYLDEPARARINAWLKATRRKKEASALSKAAG